MKIRELQKKQAELDNYIYSKNNVEVKKVYYDKIIALDVELGEFMNEVSSFKYWKNSHIMNEQKVLEEACDCFHFILSLANDLSVDLTVSHVYATTHDINNTYRLMKNELWKNLYLDNEAKAIKRIYFFLVDMLCHLGYDYADLLKEYNRKYEVNIQRQKDNY